jgi:hypothetical protein
MTWEEATDSTEFNVLGILSLVTTLILSLLDGTLLDFIPNLNLPEMNINDVITITLSVLSGIFVIVKIANGILTFVSKRADWLEERALKRKMRDHLKNKSQDNDSSGIQKESMGED